MEKKEINMLEAPVDLEASASQEQAVIAHESTNNADNSSAVDPETEITPSAEPQTSTYINNLLGLLDSTKVKKKYFISHREASMSGIKLAFVKGNRKVYSAQIDKLWNEIKKKDNKTFSRSSVVISAKAILERSEALPSDKRLHLLDLNGKELALDTPDIDKYVAVIDGQHRCMVCIEHPEADLLLELTELEGDIMELIRILNSTDKNWGLKDLSFSNIALGKSSGDLQTKIDEVKDILKMSDRAAAYLLTFKRDPIRKKDVAKGEDNSGYTEDSGNRGMNIAKAIKFKFDTEEMVCKLEFIDAITNIYTATADDKKAGFTKQMVCFLADMKEETKTSVVSEMKAGNYGQVKTLMKDGYESYIGEHTSDLETRLNELQPQIEAAMPKADATTVEELKEGLPHIILKNRAEVRHQKASTALEKAKKAVEDAQKVLDSAKTSDKRKSTVTTKAKVDDKTKILDEKQKTLQNAQKLFDDTKAALESFSNVA